MYNCSRGITQQPPSCGYRRLRRISEFFKDVCILSSDNTIANINREPYRVGTFNDRARNRAYCAQNVNRLQVDGTRAPQSVFVFSQKYGVHEQRMLSRTRRGMRNAISKPVRTILAYGNKKNGAPTNDYWIVRVRRRVCVYECTFGVRGTGAGTRRIKTGRTLDRDIYVYPRFRIMTGNNRQIFN